MRTMLKSKIHRAMVTGADIEYEGSITIDRTLMESADILPYEMAHVRDVNNGARFETYVIEGKKGEICLNGAAARMVAVGDTVIILAYQVMSDAEAKCCQPKKIYVDKNNNIVKVA